VTLIVSGLVSVIVPVSEEPEIVPLIVPDVAQELVMVTVPEKLLPVWVNVPETVDEPFLVETYVNCQFPAKVAVV
jgi:hypothetical protein